MTVSLKLLRQAAVLAVLLPMSVFAATASAQPAAPPPVTPMTLVATVDSDPVTAGELKRELTRGGTDLQAVERLTAIKVQQKLMRTHGVAKDTGYAEFLRQYKQENASRATAKTVYGPKSFTEDQYFRYRFSTDVTQLKQQLAGRELPTGDAALSQYFKTLPNERNETFAESKEKVRTLYLDHLYDQLVARLTKAAKVQIHSLALPPEASTATSTAAAPNTFYLDSVNGSDTNAGTSETQAWKSLAKVNATTFAPGDSILLKAGAAWNGKLWPKGSGTTAAHIKIDRYGTGAKPRIDGGGDIQGAVHLLNQPYWEIRNLEVTNNRGDSSRGLFVGIKVHNNTGGPLAGVYIGGNTIHDIRGYQSGYYGQNGGIAVVSDMNGSSWNQVMIENNDITAVDRIGVFVGPAVQLQMDVQALPHSTDVTIQNNVIQDSGGDGILNFITANVVIQHNVVADAGSRSHNKDSDHTGYANPASAGIWSAIADNTLIQFNEVFNDRAIYDGQGFDIDFGSHSTYVQYNYSHNNLGGMVLLCEIDAQGTDINDARIRFNISQNDGGGVITLCADYPKGPDRPDIMNNTIYLAAGSTTPVIRRYAGPTAFGEAFIYNNIFYTLGSNSYLNLPATVFDFNTFYGNHHPSEPVGGHKLTSDPGLVQPGSGYLGHDTADGYKLVAGSPSIGSGTDTGMLGSSDYWGNPVTGTPSRGAYNGPGVAARTPNFAFNGTVTSSSSAECCAYLRSKVVDGSRNSISTESGGFSSALGNFSQHEEWLAVKFAQRQTFSQVVLYPRNEPGMVGHGFPQHFHIQVWNGSEWLTRKTVSNAGSPSTPQVYTWGHADFTDQVRIVTASTNGAPDGLQSTSEGYILQLAEIEVSP